MPYFAAVVNSARYWPNGDWLLNLSELVDYLGVRPVRSHLVHALVQPDRDYVSQALAAPWPEFYARRLRSTI